MTRDATNQEMVNHPNHYNMGNPAYEPYRVIGEWGCNFNIGNAIKYLARYRQKWNPIEDLEKAKKYIEFEIERLKGVLEDAEGDRQGPSAENRSRKCRNDVLEGSDLQEPCVEEIARNRNLADRISREVDIVDRANRALDEGMSRIDVMKKILKMSDSEIDEIMRMNGTEESIAKKIARKIEDLDKEDAPRTIRHYRF